MSFATILISKKKKKKTILNKKKKKKKKIKYEKLFSEKKIIYSFCKCGS